MNQWEQEHLAKHGSPAKVEAAPVTATAAAPAVQPVVASAPEKPKNFLEKLKAQLAELEQEAVDEVKKLEGDAKAEVEKL